MYIPFNRASPFSLEKLAQTSIICTSKQDWQTKTSNQYTTKQQRHTTDTQGIKETIKQEVNEEKNTAKANKQPMQKTKQANQGKKQARQ